MWKINSVVSDIEYEKSLLHLSCFSWFVFMDHFLDILFFFFDNILVTFSIKIIYKDN